MIRLYHAPRTRSVRVRWLLEELALDYALEPVDFRPQARPYGQETPLGKVPVLEDTERGVLMCESGAILQYLLETYGQGRLEPAVGSKERAQYLQWFHYAEGTAYPPLGTILFHTMYRSDVEGASEVVEASRERARITLDFLERSLRGKYLLGEEFTAADVMMGFTLAVADFFELLDERFPRLRAYYKRLRERPAFQKATEGSL